MADKVCLIPRVADRGRRVQEVETIALADAYLGRMGEHPRKHPANDFSIGQIAWRVAFALGLTAMVAGGAFLALRYLTT